jgi:hypothetical protein
MPDTLAPLVDDLLEWIASSRPYAEVMDAWRTSCPRLPVWEEANRLGLVRCARDAGGTEQVQLTQSGRERLRASRAQVARLKCDQADRTPARRDPTARPPPPPHTSTAGRPAASHPGPPPPGPRRTAG